MREVCCGLWPDSQQIICPTQCQHFREHREKPSLRSASHARREDSWLECINKFWEGGHKNFNTSNPRVWTKKKGLHLKICADFHEFWGEDKKVLHRKKMREFLRIPGWNHKKRVFITKSAKKQFLLTDSGVITCILGVSGLELYFSGTKPVTFFGHYPRLGAQFLFGEHMQWFGGAWSRNAPCGVGPTSSLQQFIEL